MTIVAYIPRADSLAAQVVGYLTHHPAAELTLDDIVEKFGTSRGNIHTQLGKAVTFCLLRRDTNDDGEYIYKAGGNLASKASTSAPTLAPNSPFAAPPKRPRAKGERAGAMLLPDPLEVPIDDNVPMPPKRGRIDWRPLLRRLGVNQSAELPIAAKHTLARAIQIAHTDKLGVFALRTYPEQEKLRVWRTA